jgi:molybdate transport system substrate-binding protein
MATQSLLKALCARYFDLHQVQVDIEFTGGVDAAQRVQAGEKFDLVFLAAEAIERLQTQGLLVANSRCDWVTSPVAVAVASDSVKPKIDTEEQLRNAVLAAPSLSYSTGPSGTYLEQLFNRWGIFEDIKDRILVPAPGTPVGLWVAQGKAALGFQQRSELMNQPGISVLGDLPPEVACITIFSAGVGLAAGHNENTHLAATAFMHFLQTPEQRDLKRSHGMDGLA